MTILTMKMSKRKKEDVHGQIQTGRERVWLYETVVIFGYNMDIICRKY